MITFQTKCRPSSWRLALLIPILLSGFVLPAHAGTLDHIESPSGKDIPLQLTTKAGGSRGDTFVHRLDEEGLSGHVHLFGEEATGLVEEDGRWYYLHTRAGKAIYEPAETMPPLDCGLAHDDDHDHIVRPPAHVLKAPVPKSSSAQTKQEVDRNGFPEQPGHLYKPVPPPGWDEEAARRRIDARHPGQVSMDDPIPSGHTEIRLMAYAANDYVANADGIANTVVNQLIALSVANQVLENTGIDATVKLAGLFPINFTTKFDSDQDEQSPRDDNDIQSDYFYAQTSDEGHFERFRSHGILYLGGAIGDPRMQLGSADFFRNVDRYSSSRMLLWVPFDTTGPRHARIMTHELGHTWGGGHHPSNPDAGASFPGAFAGDCGRIPTLTNSPPAFARTMVSQASNQPRFSRDNFPFQDAPCGTADTNVYQAVARTIPYYRNMHLPRAYDGELTMSHEVEYTRNEDGEITGGTATITATRSGSAREEARFFVIIGGVRGMTDADVDTQHFREVTMAPNVRSVQFDVAFRAVRDHDTGQAVAYMAQGGMGVATDLEQIGFIPVPPLPTDERMFFDGIWESKTTMRAVRQLGPREFWVNATLMDMDSGFVGDRHLSIHLRRTGGPLDREVLRFSIEDISTLRTEYSFSDFGVMHEGQTELDGRNPDGTRGPRFMMSFLDGALAADTPRTVVVQALHPALPVEESKVTIHIANHWPPRADPEPTPEPEPQPPVPAPAPEPPAPSGDASGGGSSGGGAFGGLALSLLLLAALRRRLAGPM